LDHRLLFSFFFYPYLIPKKPPKKQQRGATGLFQSDHLFFCARCHGGPRCEAWVNRCISIDSYYERYLDKRQNDLVFLLTVSSVLVIPIQTLTGLYGMNFVQDGGANMPELNWRWGYLYFWLLTLGLTTCITAFLWKSGVLKLINEPSLWKTLRDDERSQFDALDANVKHAQSRSRRPPRT